MRRMKSRIVRVKVWYEHAPGLSAEMQKVGVERELLAAVYKGRPLDQSSDVMLYEVEASGKAAPMAAGPVPDFD